MTELTPAQKLRVAAALSQDGVTLRLDRKTAMALARNWDDCEKALSSMDTMTAAHAQRMAKFDDLSLWMFRTVCIIGIAQAIAAWWLA